MFLLPFLHHRRRLDTSPAEPHELRQLQHPRRVQELSELVKAKSPNLVFLMETKKKNSYLERLRCKLKFDNLFIVPRRYRGGGLALLWMNELNLHIRTYSPRHIDAVINPGIDDA